MRWTRFTNKENGILLVPRLVCLYAIIAFEGGTAGRPGGLWDASQGPRTVHASG